MSRLKLLPYRDLARVAEIAGFQWVRRQGSHNTFCAPDGRVVVIPDHGSQDIVCPLLRRIIRDMEVKIIVASQRQWLGVSIGWLARGRSKPPSLWVRGPDVAVRAGFWHWALG